MTGFSRVQLTRRDLMAGAAAGAGLWATGMTTLGAEQAEAAEPQTDAELSVLHGSARLGSLQSEQDCLRLLEQVESLAQGAYYVSISKLADVKLARTCASILGAEAQHYTALAGLLHPGDINKAVPGAFVEGSA